VRILPIDAQLARPEVAERVVVPSFDALSPAERQRVRDTEPASFLHAMHAPVEGALTRSLEGLQRLLDTGVFGDVLHDVVLGYRITAGGRSETGLVCAIPAASFAPGGEVLSHEDVRPEMVGHLTHYLREIRVASSPVKTAFPASPTVARLLDEVTSRPPDLDAGDPDAPHGVRQEVWTVTDPDRVAAFVDAFAAVDRAYITDGHHRSAAALALGPDTPVLTALFPDDAVHIVQFNRVVRPVADHEPVHTWLAETGAVPLDGPPAEVAAGTVAVACCRRWWRASLPTADGLEPPASLDPAVLQSAVLGPLLGVTDPAGDPRLTFVPGSVSNADLAGWAGDDGIAFALAPVAFADVRAVADRGASMPPKSTYFEPKPRSGLVLLRL
jgi:uncharacterized protein (DUF1015 family)